VGNALGRHRLAALAARGKERKKEKGDEGER
jgi:hypothetical protein